MGRIDRDASGNVLIHLDSPEDVRLLRVALKGSDGADEIELGEPGTVTLSADNPFHFVALWSTDFEWSPGVLRLALDTLVPPARSALHLHTKSHRSLMRRFLRNREPAAEEARPKRPD